MVADLIKSQNRFKQNNNKKQKKNGKHPAEAVCNEHLQENCYKCENAQSDDDNRRGGNRMHLSLSLSEFPAFCIRDIRMRPPNMAAPINEGDCCSVRFCSPSSTLRNDRVHGVSLSLQPLNFKCGDDFVHCPK